MADNIIQFMTGEQMASAISQASQAVSGLSAAEAAAALGTQNIGSQGFTKITTFPLLGGNNFKPITVEAQYAAQTWQYYKTAAEAAGITSFGAAAGAAATWANGVLFGTGQGTLAATGGLLTLSAPAAVAAVAPLLGVALGGVLYESNPELWTKISDKVQEFCYKGTQAVAAVVNELGQVYVPKGLVDAVDEVFTSEGIGGGSGKISSLNTIVQQPVNVTGAGTEFWNGSGTMVGAHFPLPSVMYYKNNIHSVRELAAIVFSDSPGSVYLTYRNGSTAGGGSLYPYTHDGKTVYYLGFGTGSDPIATWGTVTYNPPNTYKSGNIAQTAWTALYGSDYHYYPVGTSEWTGTKPATLPEVPVIIVLPEDPGQSIVEVPYTPIQLPEPGAPPYISPDPEKQPNPQAPVPLPYIDPFIDPFIPWQWPEELPEPRKEEEEDPDPRYAPIPDPVRRREPYVDPYIDPTKKPDPIPDPKPIPWPDPRTWPDSPQTPDPPTSTGESPPNIPAFPDFPSIVPKSDVAGLIHVYNPTPDEMQAFGRWLWVTWQDATIQKMWNNPFDGIIGAMELYTTPTTGAAEMIRSGFLESSIAAKTVPVRYKTINCGSIVIPEYWNNYLDYAPYSKAYIYLPFIGIVELEVDDIVGHAVNVTYHVDCYNGSCIAQITVARDDYSNTVYQFSGNCAVDVPLAGGTQAAIRAGMIQAAAYGISSVIGGILGAGASSSPAGALSSIGSGLAYGAANAINSVVSAKSSVQHSGSFGASYGAMGIKRPYIIIRRPVQKRVENYNKEYGFPAHKMVQIGMCTGFLRVREVNVISPTASNEEKAMIEQLLKTGVYVTSE